ncbi:hypothetical protein PR202_ga27625 [Eleusine coracana subsp. coracana]|uniref:BTB domain-containing protein n=1 Tax=Eleusine coracana subsp. coracana TaxID=191504 RepID=A0AAV5DH01_ELECO|nr:hypothetical protein PR202_ga27625 [Eleusine coracana subsp. coracana]
MSTELGRGSPVSSDDAAERQSEAGKKESIAGDSEGKGDGSSVGSNRTPARSLRCSRQGRGGGAAAGRWGSRGGDGERLDGRREQRMGVARERENGQGGVYWPWNLYDTRSVTLLEDKEGADITFSVGREKFPAHKVVLFMRSPVLKGQLLGPMRDKGTDIVTVDDMQPEVFRALLHFIYTTHCPT